ncbi:MAG: cellulose binding domain-containing protein [Polyangiaceae bacterium]
MKRNVTYLSSLFFAVSSMIGCASTEDADLLATTTKDAEKSIKGASLAVVKASAISATAVANSDWPQGYCAEVKITNNSAAAVLDWTVTLDVGAATISNAWGGVFSGATGLVKVTAPPYGTPIAAGSSISAGFCVTKSTASDAPRVVSAGIIGNEDPWLKGEYRLVSAATDSTLTLGGDGRFAWQAYTHDDHQIWTLVEAANGYNLRLASNGLCLYDGSPGVGFAACDDLNGRWTIETIVERSASSRGKFRIHPVTSNTTCLLPHPSGPFQGSCAGADWYVDPADSVYVTYVPDNLSATDGTLFTSRFVDLGYTDLGTDATTTSAELLALLERSDITTLYHTGHGYSGGIATDGGALDVSDVTTIRAETAIFATCLTLRPTTWMAKMGDSSKHLLGYSDITWDAPVDDEVVTRFADSLQGGSSYMRAWYLSNDANSGLSDRWVGYVRESAGIVEYSARTNHIPTDATLVSLDGQGKVLASAALLGNRATAKGNLSSALRYRLVSHRAKNVAWTKEASTFLPSTRATESDAIAAAQRWIDTNAAPGDAAFDRAIPIARTTELGSTETVGYSVRFTKSIAGLTVRANGVEPHLTVLVSGREVVGTTEHWATAVAQPPEKAAALLDVAAAVRAAAPNIARRVKGAEPAKLVSAEPCLGKTRDGELVPSYRVLDASGGAIVLDASTGALL